MILEIRVPQLGPNDQTATVVEWVVNDYEPLRQSQPICLIETSKTTLEIVAERSGYLKIRVLAGAEIQVNQVIGWISDSVDLLQRLDEPSKTDLEKKVHATAKAIQLAKKLGIDINAIDQTDLIRENDVRKFYEGIRKY